MHEDEGNEGWGGGGGVAVGCGAVPKRNADCFHVWGGQENCAGCSQVRLALMRKVVLAMEEAQDTADQRQSTAKNETTV